VLAQSHARINKERAMRRRKLKWLWARLKQIAPMENLLHTHLRLGGLKRRRSAELVRPRKAPRRDASSVGAVAVPIGKFVDAETERPPGRVHP
jgi:hypothetical protein